MRQRIAMKMKMMMMSVVEPLDNSSVSLSFVQAFVDINAVNERLTRRISCSCVWEKSLEYTSKFIIFVINLNFAFFKEKFLKIIFEKLTI